MRRTIDSHHHGELPAAKELIHDSMRRSTAGPADFRTFWTHACARELGFTSAGRSRTILSWDVLEGASASAAGGRARMRARAAPSCKWRADRGVPGLIAASDFQLRFNEQEGCV